MIIAGIVKEHNLFNSTYGWLKTRFKSNRVVIIMLSLVSGIIPIEGRSTVSASILDTATSKSNCCGSEHDNNDSRKKLGIIDFLTTHHFYMWSPIEKPVLLPMAAFGLGYSAWIGMIWPLLLVSALFIGLYAWFMIDEHEVNIEAHPSINPWDFLMYVLPFIIAIFSYMYFGGEGTTLVFSIFGMLVSYYIIITETYDYKVLNSYINWKTLLIISVVLITSGYMQEHREWIEQSITSTGLDPSTFKGMLIISIITFAGSFSMGSDGKFAAITVMMTTVFGLPYLLWFFALDYVGYLLSPAHDCVMIGKRYFGTSLTVYYTALISWSILLLLVAGAFTFKF
jgi:hypothetical protein